MTDSPDLTVKEIAALARTEVRARVAELKKDGALPATAKVSVRYDTASQMQAIDVTVTAPKAWFAAADVYNRALHTSRRRHLEDELLAILNTRNSYPSPASDRPRFWTSVNFDFAKEG